MLLVDEERRDFAETSTTNAFWKGNLLFRATDGRCERQPVSSLSFRRGMKIWMYQRRSTNAQDAANMWKKRKRFWKDKYRRRLAASCEHGENVDVFALRFIRHGAAPSNNMTISRFLKFYHEPYAWEMMFLEIIIWLLKPTSRFADFAALQHALTLLTLLTMQWNMDRRFS